MYQVVCRKNVARGSFAVGAVGARRASRSPPCARRTRGPCPARSWKGGGASACTASTTRSRASPAASCRTRCSPRGPARLRRRHRSTWGEAPPVEACARHRRPARAPAAAAGRRPTARRSSSAASTGPSEPRLFRTEPSGAYGARGVGGVAAAGAAPTGRPSRTWSAPRGFGDVADGADAAARRPSRPRAAAAGGPERRARRTSARRAAALGLRDLRRGRASRAAEQRTSSNGCGESQHPV